MFQQDDQGLCVAEGQDPNDPFSDLDPDRECDLFVDYVDFVFQKYFVLAPCKNNCRGGTSQHTNNKCIYLLKNNMF